MITLKIHTYSGKEREKLLSILLNGRELLTEVECNNQCALCKFKELCRDINANIRYLDEYDSPA